MFAVDKYPKTAYLIASPFLISFSCVFLLCATDYADEKATEPGTELVGVQSYPIRSPRP